MIRVSVPSGWVEKENPDLLGEWWASEDGARGLVQVSQLPLDQFPVLSDPERLGELASLLGSRLEGFGQPGGTKAGQCSIGRYGFCFFPAGRFPAMFLWLTVSPIAAYMWTYLGPDPKAIEVKDAISLVLTAAPS